PVQQLIDRHRGDGPRRQDQPADAVVAEVADVDGARAVAGGAPGGAESSFRTRQILESALGRLAREGGDGSGRERDLPNGVVFVIGDVEVSGTVGDDAGRPGEAGGGARAVRAAVLASAARDGRDGARRD